MDELVQDNLFYLLAGRLGHDLFFSFVFRFCGSFRRFCCQVKRVRCFPNP